MPLTDDAGTPSLPAVGPFTEYVRAAMLRATFKPLEDGTVWGEIPGLQGLWANADTIEEDRIPGGGVERRVERVATVYRPIGWETRNGKEYTMAEDRLTLADVLGKEEAARRPETCCGRRSVGWCSS